MIYGLVRCQQDAAVSIEALRPFHAARLPPAPGRESPASSPQEAACGTAALGYQSEGIPSLEGGLHRDSDGLAVAQGLLTNRPGLLGDLSAKGFGLPPAASLAEIVLATLRCFGLEGAQQLEGTVAFAALDQRTRLAVVCRDRLGVEPLFHGGRQQEILFCSRAAGVADALGARRLDGQALREFLLLGYLVGERSLFEGVRRLLGGHGLVAQEGTCRRLVYWDPGPLQVPAGKAAAISSLRERMGTAVRVRLEQDLKAGVFLSGGLDSSTVTALACQQGGAQRLSTFSFRCQGESYDESRFAALLATRLGTRHHLVEYTADQLQSMVDLAGAMDEPFCDIGINMATWILAREAARSGVRLILTGDGGDELFCGHPVYAAARLAHSFRVLPVWLQRWPARFLGRLSDSEAKKDLKVKLKRFSQGLGFPKDLGPSRWRCQATPAAIEAVLTGAYPPVKGEDPYSGLRWALAGARTKGIDAAAAEVLADYRIVVEFYLRRLVLARRWGIEVRAPWLDHRLVEMAASLPSAWRVRGLRDEKVLMKQVIEPWLPREITHRSDKLGHSVPFKNWLRSDPHVRGLVEEALGTASLKRRGLFQPAAVERIRASHDSGRHNESHRIWTMTVLEFWMRGNLP